MNLLELFSKHAPNKVFIAIFLGALSGVAYALLIPVMLTSLETAPAGLSIADTGMREIFGISVAKPKFAGLFLILCVVILVARSLAQVLLARISMDVTSKLRQSLYERIYNTPIAYLEQRRSGELIQTMTTDVQRIVQGAGMIPELLIKLSTLVGTMVFLYYLNDRVFVFVWLTIVFGVVTFQLPIYIGMKYFTRARDHMDELQEGFKGLVEGAKELKLNRGKRDHFMAHQLLSHERKVVRNEKAGFTIIQVAQNYGDLIGFFSMGIIGFIYINYHAISVAELTGIIMVLLYITGPVAAILNLLPELSRAKVSLRKVQLLFDELPHEQASKQIQPVPEWGAINIHAVGYQYLNKGSAGAVFAIGPINAQIKRGEITFIVGGNGSGKSTFSKVMSLHYLPTSGAILFDQVEVTPDTLNSYRQEIACIYSDYYLFKQLHSAFSLESELLEKVEFYLELLELKGKVEFSDGHFSTLQLSDGQRRRLALLVAFLDNKHVYIFDEWAADQDPHFKQIFYFNILPTLKAQGKAVIAISHDDRYFHVADQILVMEDGQLKSTARASENAFAVAT
jgi:putative pyoverdin transport system ATP-binding/permease protein